MACGDLGQGAQFAQALQVRLMGHAQPNDGYAQALAHVLLGYQAEEPLHRTVARTMTPSSSNPARDPKQAQMSRAAGVSALIPVQL
jgi:hypothetical protein